MKYRFPDLPDDFEKFIDEHYIHIEFGRVAMYASVPYGKYTEYTFRATSVCDVCGYCGETRWIAPFAHGGPVEVEGESCHDKGQRHSWNHGSGVPVLFLTDTDYDVLIRKARAAIAEWRADQQRIKNDMEVVRLRQELELARRAT